MGKKRDRHAELKGLLVQLLDELRAQRERKTDFGPVVLPPGTQPQPLVIGPFVAYMAPPPGPPWQWTYTGTINLGGGK